MPETPSSGKDPVVGQSLSLPLMVSALLLILTLVWAIYDEAYGQRPWKGYQENFAGRFTAFLNQAVPRQGELEQQIRQSPQYQELERRLQEAEESSRDEMARITSETRLITEQIAALNKVFQESRGKISALTYQLETASADRRKQSLQQQIEQVRLEDLRVDFPDGNGNVRRQFQYPGLEEELNQLKARKAQLQTQLVQLQQPPSEIRKELQTY